MTREDEYSCLWDARRGLGDTQSEAIRKKGRKTSPSWMHYECGESLARLVEYDLRRVQLISKQQLVSGASATMRLEVEQISISPRHLFPFHTLRLPLSWRTGVSHWKSCHFEWRKHHTT